MKLFFKRAAGGDVLEVEEDDAQANRQTSPTPDSRRRRRTEVAFTADNSRDARQCGVEEGFGGLRSDVGWNGR